MTITIDPLAILAALTAIGGLVAVGVKVGRDLVNGHMEGKREAAETASAQAAANEHEAGATSEVAEAIKMLAGATSEIYGPIRAELAEVRAENLANATRLSLMSKQLDLANAKLDEANETIEELRDEVRALRAALDLLAPFAPKEIAEQAAALVQPKRAAPRRRRDTQKDTLAA